MPPMSPALLAIAILAAAVSSEIPEEQNLGWQVNHSTDVAEVKIVGHRSLNLSGLSCGMTVWMVEIGQSFKGAFLPGQQVEVWGPDATDTWPLGSTQLMFMRWYDGESYNECSSHLFSNYRQVHWSCCEIQGIGPDAVVLFETMINSEEAGPDIPVLASKVYEALRGLRERPGN